jgi:hypothetical protein
MSTGGIIDAGTGLANSIGRYFSVISIVPSSLYVTFVYTLIASDSWWHTPDWSRGFRSLEHLGLGGFSLLAFFSIAIGVIIHPTQFAIVQFFEGYWGNANIVQTFRSRRILHYQHICKNLSDKEMSAGRQLSQTGAGISADRARFLSLLGEANRVRDAFPRALDHVMPTRLGNTLRRTEAQAGSQYRLDALTAVPHLLMIAPPGHVDYVNDQRSQLDLAVRMTFMSVLACATSLLFLLHDGCWVFVAVIPYVLAYLSYRGSIIAASHYGSALETLINLDRFALYKQLHLELPHGTVEERRANVKVAELFSYDPEVVIRYEHPVDDGG